MAASVRLPALMFYVQDWLTSKAVLRMSHLERGLYFHLLCLAWVNDEEPGVIEADDETLAGLLGISVEEWGAHRVAIGRAWDTTSRDGWWIQKRLVEEHSKHVEYIKRQRKLGEKGAVKRWKQSTVSDPMFSGKGAHRVPIGSDRDVDVDVDSKETESPPTPSAPTRERSASPQENPNGHSPDKADPDDLTPAEFFDQHFWPNYPRKKARASARREWLRAVGVKGGDARLANRIVDALLSISRVDWRDREEKFIPYAHTWLSQRRWEDS